MITLDEYNVEKDCWDRHESCEGFVPEGAAYVGVESLDCPVLTVVLPDGDCWAPGNWCITPLGDLPHEMAEVQKALDDGWLPSDRDGWLPVDRDDFVCRDDFGDMV